MTEEIDTPTALAELDKLARRLRRECPWDREQDERSIVPHTVEEAYELADAAYAQDDAQLLDELGDVLFSVYFLSLLLEERGVGSLAEVATHSHRKLVRRHPHIFGEANDPRREASTASEVLDNWDEIKRSERDQGNEIFGGVPENLPGPLFARRTLKQVANSGFDFDHIPYEAIRDELTELENAKDRDERFHEVGDLLLASVNVARKLKVDPELALRSATKRFRRRVETAASLASQDNLTWRELDPEEQLKYYALARRQE